MSRQVSGGSPPGGGDEENIFSRDRPTAGGTWARRAGVLGATAMLLLGVWVWMRGSGGGLNAMSPAQRAVFFQETRDALRSQCLSPDAGTGGTAERCRKQAGFLQRFPECDAACQQEIAPLLPRTGG